MKCGVPAYDTSYAVPAPVHDISCVVPVPVHDTSKAVPASVMTLHLLLVHSRQVDLYSVVLSTQRLWCGHL